MKLNDRKQTIPWTGLGLILGGAIGSFLGMRFSLKYFAIFCGGGAGIGLIMGAMVDNWIHSKESDDKEL